MDSPAKVLRLLYGNFVSNIFVFFQLQNGASVIWIGMRMSSFADSTLYSMMTSLWSSLEHLETALKSKESTCNADFINSKNCL